MKTNKPGKQNILFLHVEKIVFLVLILATLYYCYSGVALPLISWTPDQLTRDSSTAQQTIDNSVYREDLKIVNYDVRAKDIRTGFPHENYRTLEKWDPAVFPEKIRRVNPGIDQLFPVVKLRATVGVGALTVKPPQSVFDSSSTTMAGGMSQDMGGMGGGMGAMGVMGVGMSGGMMGGMGASGTGRTENANWVLLTGLIPYEEQLREYTKLYANALHSSAADYPVYLFMRIQRNEIGDNEADGSPRWVELNTYNQYVENNRTWAGVGLDPVDIQYTLPPPSPYFQPMASPLPPLVNRQYGYEVAYPPHIPLMSDSLREQMKAQQILQGQLLDSQRNLTPEDIRKNELGELDIFTVGATSGMGGGMGMTPGGTGMGMSGSSGGMGAGTGGGANAISGMYQGGAGGTSMGMGMGTSSGGLGTSGMGMPGGASTGMGMGMSGGSGTSGMGMGMGMGGTSGGFGNAGMSGNTWTRYTNYPPSVMVNMKYRLFRYFDFTVEPGKSYQYRVSLGLKNPNYLLADRFLTEEAAKEKKTLELYTEFSAPSGNVAVNSNARILAQSVANPPQANRAWQQQGATISSIVFDEADKEDYIAKGKNVAVGAILNFSRTSGERLSEFTSSGMGMGSDMSGGMGMSPSPGMGMGPGGRTSASSSKPSTKTLDHISNDCLVDVVGKGKLIGSNSDHSPAGQIMVMAFDGTLSIRSVKEDKLELDRYEKKTTGADSMMGLGMGRMN